MARWHNTEFDFYPEQAFRPRPGGGMTLEGGGKGSPAPAPDYGPMAKASEESAKIAAELGHAQLDENKRQYENNMTVAQPLIEKQGQIMDQSIQQGQDYYDYNKSQSRPVEAAINAEAMAAGSDQRQAEAADRAVADARAGTTANANMMARQGLRYGWSPEKMAAAAGEMSANQGLAEATAANGARTAEKNLGYAKKLDAAGMYRGLAGASTAAYGVASGAGSAGVNSQMGVSNQYMQGINAGNSTVMGGRSLYQQGLGNILSTQGQAFASSQQSSGDMMGGIGSLVGAGAKLWSMSDRRLKENIVKVGDFNGMGVYEFNYLATPGARWRGMMADEVAKVMPSAVSYTPQGYAAVDYGQIGYEMTEV